MNRAGAATFHTRLAIVLPTIPINPLRMGLFTGTLRWGEKAGYHLTLTFLRGEAEEVVEVGRMADAILPFVALPPDIQARLDEEGIKVLQPLISAGQPFFEIYALLTGSLGRAAVERMVQRGRTDLVYVCDANPSVELLNQLRYAAMIQYCVENGIKSPKMLKIESGDENLAGCLVEFLQKNQDVDGFLCHTDLYAIEIMQALRMLGRLVPADLAVIGTDDIPEGAVVHPTLTSVTYDLDQVILMSGHALAATLGQEEYHIPELEDIEDLVKVVARQSA